MPVELLAENNPCGQTLLHLVARGSAIITELLRLSEFIPSVFSQDNRPEQARYTDILADFSYFKASDGFEKKIEANQHLQDLDDEFRENNLEILTRFYVLFESIHRYATDLNRFVEELEEGVYIQQNIETVFLNEDGRQLMTEGLYLYGVMLLLVDQKIQGLVRERLLVSYYRYSAHTSSMDSSVDEVCRLMRSTGYSAGSKRPPNYPDSYFSRVTINKAYVNVVIGRLRSDDLYSQIPAYPLPEHRSAALAPQGAMLYVCLYFSPEILHQSTAIMREIVDKYFPDNWVVSVYMGMLANLVEEWEPYRAAKAALSNSLDVGNVRLTAARHGEEIVRLNATLQQALQEGALTREHILDNSTKLMNIVRKCNVTLRWLMLHTTPLSAECELIKQCKQLRDQAAVDSKCRRALLFEFLLNTSQFELKLKELLKSMLSDRAHTWKSLQKDATTRLSELADVFSGTTPLTRVEKNEKLQTWFRDISQKVAELDANNAMVAGKHTVQLIRALEEVQEFHNLAAQLQVRQFLTDTRQVLMQMLRTIAMQDECLVHLQIVGDLSYAWVLIDTFTNLMQDGIKQNPIMSIQLRATFLKLGSALDLPLLRIQQAGSPDLVSVSQYYSSELVLYVRRVLQIIPETVFSLLSQIIRLQTTEIKEVPTRLDKDKMKEYAQLDQRYEVARLTHAISILTEGVLAMKTTLVGIIKVDPKQLLEDGIRKELVRILAGAMHTSLIFNLKAKSELFLKLRGLAQQMDGFRRSFEYISDYVNLSGLKIWLEEFRRLVNFYVEQECNSFLRQKVQHWESMYQSRTIPIPVLPSSDTASINFIGRLGREIMRVTDPRVTVYVHSLGFWYDQKTHKECAGPQLWKLLLAALSNIGLVGLDRLYSFMIQRELQMMAEQYKRSVLGDKEWLGLLANAQSVTNAGKGLVGNASKFYATLTNRYAKSALATQMGDTVLKIGQLQILRLHLVRELNSACKFESKLLENTLQTFNRTLLSDLLLHYNDSTKPYPKDDSPLLYELTNYLENAGMVDPLRKLYAALPPQDYFPLFVSFLTLTSVTKLSYVKSIGLISKRPQDSLDGYPFVFGVLTLMQQFHQQECSAFMVYLCQHVESMLISTTGPPTRAVEFPAEVCSMLAFLTEFEYFAGKSLDAHLPKYLLEAFKSCSAA